MSTARGSSRRSSLGVTRNGPKSETLFGLYKLEIDPSGLSPEALDGVVEEFVTRGGIEYQDSVEERKALVKEALRRGRARLYYDPNEGTIHIQEAPQRPTESDH